MEYKYIEAVYDFTTQERLRNYCLENGFDLTVKFDKTEQKPEDFDFHTTIWFTNTQHDLENESYRVDFDTYPCGFDLFGENKNILVLEVKSLTLNAIRDFYGKEYGMDDDFPSYRAHITVCYDYEPDEIPDIDLPDFDLHVDQINIKTAKRD